MASRACARGKHVGVAATSLQLTACICGTVYIVASAHAHAFQFAVVRSISEVYLPGRRWGGGQEDWSATLASGGWVVNNVLTLAVRSGVRGSRSHSCMHSRCPVMCASVLII